MGVSFAFEGSEALTTAQLQAVLIHHQLPARQPYRQQLRDLCEKLGVSLTEIVEQSPLLAEHVTIADGVWLVGRYWLKSGADAFFQWRSGRDSFVSALRRFVVEAFKSILNLVLITPEARLSAYRACLVEGILVQKHMAAWQCGLRDDCEWLLVFEDDALIQAETKSRLQLLFETELRHWNSAQWIYCDLAGGYDPNQALPVKSCWDPLLERWCLSHIRTNTICSYLVSRQVLTGLLSVVERYPWLRQLPADHLINFASLIAVDAHTLPRCFHWREPFFRHGSFHAALASTVSGIR